MTKIRAIVIALVLALPSLAGYTSFNSGELSPLMQGRTDLKKYYSGCRTLENFVVLPQGPVTKRPGTKYIGTAKDTATAVRLIPFEFSTEQAYVIEMGDLYMRFYRDGGQITSAGSPVEVVTPYVTADLFDVQFVQSADTMYLVHNSYEPYVLTRTSHTSWTNETIEFVRGPFLTANDTQITLTPSGLTGSITVTASTDMFTADHEGSLWRITHPEAGKRINGTFTANGTSATISVKKGQAFTWHSNGIWTAVATLQKSYDAGVNWRSVAVIARTQDTVAHETEELSETEDLADAIYRIEITGYVSNTYRYELNTLSTQVHGVVKITGFSSATTVAATVVNDLAGITATTKWAEGAFSAENGYPSAVAFYDERLAVAGTTEEPQTVWLSQTDDWTNFEAGALATDSLRYSIASDQVNKILWLSPQRALLIGTTGAEWKLSASSPDEPLAPDNFSAKRQSTYGNDPQQAISVNNNVFFVQRQARKIRQMKYAFEDDNYVAADLTLLSEHLVAPGIKEMALQRAPYTILWVVTDDGDLLSLTFEEFEQVIGWAKHIFDGDVESVAVIAGSGEDEVWVAVERTIDSSVTRYVEQVQPYDWGDDQEDAIYVDASISYDGGAAVTITGVTVADPAVVTAVAHNISDGAQIRISDVVGMTELNDNVYSVGTVLTADTFELRDFSDSLDIDSTGFTAYTSGGEAVVVENSFIDVGHLEAEVVQVAGDGGDAGTYTVAGGALTLDDYYNTVHVGLGYTAKLKPVRLEFPSTGGALQGVTKRIIATTVRLNETLGCDIGPSFAKFDSLIFRDADDPLEAATPLFTGDKRILFRGPWETDGDICIQQSLPLPITIVGLPRVEYEANK